MNAMLPPIDNYNRLSRYQISMIVNLATRQKDSLPVRAEKLKALSFCTDTQNRQFIEDYHSGMTKDELSEKYGLTKKQVIQKIADFKRRGSLKETTKMKDETKAVQTETKPETISDALTALDEVNPEKMPKAFTATGRGFMTTDNGLKLDEEPITTMLRQKIIEKGLRQFYAEVEITIRPVTPTGMIVAVEE